ncbi:hypothetical protein RND71_034581 [Anisodus tanguticus]|uniref:Uncharacterized protein n=1 Tax=Anisodus tanguticus TaxID=243964 RepID=A0AAE1RCW2_9SOLA|nr:hypothetical protein RND71_034581 [Anisodus tanguticus]
MGKWISLLLEKMNQKHELTWTRRSMKRKSIVGLVKGPINIYLYSDRKVTVDVKYTRRISSQIYEGKYSQSAQFSNEHKIAMILERVGWYSGSPNTVYKNENLLSTPFLSMVEPIFLLD